MTRKWGGKKREGQPRSLHLTAPIANILCQYGQRKERWTLLQWFHKSNWSPRQFERKGVGVGVGGGESVRNRQRKDSCQFISCPCKVSFRLWNTKWHRHRQCEERKGYRSTYPSPPTFVILRRKSTELRFGGFHFRMSSHLPGLYLCRHRT